MPGAGWPTRPSRKGWEMAVTRTEGARTGLMAGGIAAIVFAVLFVVGFLLTSDTPDGDESDLKWVRYFADSGHRRMIVTGAILLTLAAVAFLIFLGVLRERLRVRGNDRGLHRGQGSGRRRYHVRRQPGAARRHHHAQLREPRVRRPAALRSRFRRAAHLHDVDR